MHRLLAVALFATVAYAAEEKTVKNATARGYYGGAGQDQPVATQPIYYPVYPPPPGLEDRNVCDLDAGILLVTDKRHRHHHGQYKAVRVRCSEIANYDEDSCNVCCQNAARRDRNLPNTAMFGFLALTEEKDDKHKSKEHNKDRSDNGSPEELEDSDDRRKKRGADWSKEHDVERTTVKQENWKPDPQYKNLKCVCCAPKRPLPVYTYPQPYGQQQQQYGQAPPQQSYGQLPPQSPPQTYQPAQSPPAQTYQPAQAPPQQNYQPQPPAQSPPAQNYQQAPPAAAPAYQPPQQNPVPY